MRKEYLMAAITIFSWATLPPMTKLFLSDFPSMTLLYYSSVIASVMLLLVLLLTGEIKQIKQYSKNDLLPMAGLGFLGNFLYSALYYKALTMISSIDACILNYLWPVFAVIASCIFLKERLTLGRIGAIIVSFIGVIFVTSKGTGFSMFLGNSILGCIYCVIAAVCYGAFNVLNKKFKKNQWINTTFYFILTAIIAGVFCHFSGQIMVPTVRQWIGILWLGLFIDAIGIVIWALALQKSKVSSLVNFAYATPVVSMFLSAILLHERIDIYSCIGLTLILVSFFIPKVNFRFLIHFTDML